MLGNNRHNWAAIPGRHTSAESAHRRAQCAKLDNHAALTIVRAPTGYGKSTLIASWLRATHITERTFVWVPAPVATTTARDYWAGVLVQLHQAGIALASAADTSDPDPFAAVLRVLTATERRVVLVLIRPDSCGKIRDRELLEIAVQCRNVDIVVTLTGRAMFPQPHLLDVEQESITAQDLLFTAADTESLLELSGARIFPGESERVHSVIGGLPALALRAVTVVKNLPVDASRTDRLDHYLQQLLEHFTAELFDGDPRLREQYDFIADTICARTLTVASAQLLHEPRESDERTHDRLISLERAGILLYVGTPTEDSWIPTPAIRRAIMARQVRSGIPRAPRLSFLAHRELTAGRYTCALDYAVEAEDWPLAVDIIEQHWITMIVDDIDSVRSAFERIPVEAAGKHPTARLGRTLFTKYQTAHTNSSVTLPESAAELRALGAGAESNHALTVGCIRCLELVHAGEYEQAAELARKLAHLSRVVLENNPDDINARLPILRMQWAITYQLNGQLVESIMKARMAYRGGVSNGLGFVARAAAGTISLNWAMVGETRKAHYWLELEKKHRGPCGGLEPIVKVSGLTARALISLNNLDLGDAQDALDELGHPTESDELWAGELWAFVVYAHCHYALTRRDAFAALSLLHRTVAANAAQCGPASFAQPLMRSTEIDLLLALGDGHKAAAVAAQIADPARNPWTLVSVARVRQRMGHHEAALALCHQLAGRQQAGGGHEWPSAVYPRMHMESLLIQALAYAELREPARAADAWRKACTIADQTGMLRPFATVTAEDVDMLQSLSPVTSSALARFEAGGGAALFPTAVHIVSLTAREHRVLSLLAQGLGTAGMAGKLHVSTNTVKSQLRSLYRKLDAHNRNEAIAKAHALQFLASHPSDADGALR